MWEFSHSQFDQIPAALTAITDDVTARNESGGGTEHLKRTLQVHKGQRLLPSRAEPY